MKNLKELKMELTELIVEAYTSPSVWVIDSEETIDVALDLMREHSIRHLPVSKGSKIIGLISDRDLKPFSLNLLRDSIKVGELAIEDVYTARQDAPLLDVVYTMSERKIGSAVIVDEFGKLTGIFTTTDALNALIEIIRGDVDKFVG
jgi:acetoin utilization protein AcuB